MATAELITGTCEEPGCGGIIVYDPQRSAWHHTDYRLGLDHAPRLRYEHPRAELTGGSVPAHVVGAYPRLSCCGGPVELVSVGQVTCGVPDWSERDRAILTEAELRLMDGNR